MRAGGICTLADLCTAANNNQCLQPLATADSSQELRSLPTWCLVLHHNNSHTSGIHHLSTTNKCSNSLMHVAEQPANEQFTIKAQACSCTRHDWQPTVCVAAVSWLSRAVFVHGSQQLTGALPSAQVDDRTHVPWLRPFISDPNQLWGIQHWHILICVWSRVRGTSLEHCCSPPAHHHLPGGAAGMHALNPSWLLRQHCGPWGQSSAGATFVMLRDCCMLLHTLL